MSDITRRNFVKGALVSLGGAAAFGIAGCSSGQSGDGGSQGSNEQSSSDQSTSTEKQEWTFVDQADNEVTVKIPVERMVVCLLYTSPSPRDTR